MTFLKNHYKHFFEQLTSCGFYPKISMPTRFTEHSATLIDNISTNHLENNGSCILTNSISDHQMIFTYSKNNKVHKKQNKYIEVKVKNDKSLNFLLRELESINLQDYLDFN